MAGVRNGPLARMYVTTPGVTLLGTVPPNFTWLLKTVHYVVAATSTGRAHLQLAAAAGTPIAIVADQELAPDGWSTWEGWTALGPGDRVYLSTNEAPIHVWLVGAELPGAIP